MALHPSRRDFLLTTGAALATAGVAMRPARAATSVKVTLNAPFDGSNAAFFLAEQRGYYEKVGLSCQFDSSGGAVEAVTRVGSGTYDFAFTDINVLMEFNAKNPDKAARDVYMLYYRSPLAAIFFKKSGIAKPADLAGKTLGAALTDAAYRLFPAFTKQTGLNPDSVKWKYVDLRLREALLLRGEVDAILGFDSTSYFNLLKAGAKAEDIGFLYYSDVGLPLYSNSLVASKTMFDTQPGLVKAFVAASAQGWKEAIADPDAAIAALKKKDGLVDVKLETEKIRWLVRNQITSEESKTKGLGNVDPKRLTDSIATVCAAFGVPVPPPSLVFDAGFMPPEDVRRLPA